MNIHITDDDEIIESDNESEYNSSIISNLN